MPGPQPSPVTILSETVVLANTDIKALPTTLFQILAAPGSSQFIHVQEIVLVLDNQAGAYTNTLDFQIVGRIGTWGATNVYMENDQLAFEDSSGSPHVIRIPPVTSSTGQASWFADLDGVKGLPLMLASTGGTDLTGGNVANTLQVTVLYTVIDT
jgi:hypothetical protein